MCGISGWLAFEHNLAEPRNRAIARLMNIQLRLRGPDDQRVWHSQHAALGNTRLAFQDVKNGVQPVSVEVAGHPVTITHSGEIYNVSDLREELVKLGHKFRTNSDTEVILYGYLEWGTDVATHLRGMFAYAIWDSRLDKRRLVLTRDYMGTKPLYYKQTKDGLLFGSEPKAIFANPLAVREVETEGFLRFWDIYKVPGLTMYKDVYEVKQGSTVIVNRDGLKGLTYWRPTTDVHSLDDDATVEWTRATLQGAVKEQQVADSSVRVGAVLSGGIDSSGICALMAGDRGDTNQPLRTYSLTHEVDSDTDPAAVLQLSDDSPFAHEMASFLGSRHSELQLTPEMMMDQRIWRSVVNATETAFASDPNRSMFMLFQLARRDVKALLVGDGADELFGGYRKSYGPVPPGFPWESLHRDDVAAERASLRPDLRKELDLDEYSAAAYRDAIREVVRLDGESDHEFRIRQITYLYLTRYVRVLMDRNERIGMAAGIELRYPFLDHRLVQGIYNTPWRLRFDGIIEKSLERRAFEGLMPQGINQRPKSPLPSSGSARLIRMLQAQVQTYMEEPNSRLFDVFQPEALRNLTRLAPSQMKYGDRSVLNRALGLVYWLEMPMAPSLELSAMREPEPSLASPSLSGRHLGSL
jgi:asparagine synthase (glutamine-hydrolysing)